MAWKGQENRSMGAAKKEHSGEAAVPTLHDELRKGIESMRSGKVYTIEEAWEEIDKI